MKNAVNPQNDYSPIDLEREIVQFMGSYNNQRCHALLDNLSPMDLYTGKAETGQAKQTGIKKRTVQTRRLQNLQALAAEGQWFRVGYVSLSKCRCLSQMF